LTLTPQAPQVFITPGRLDFGEQPLKTVSEAQTIALVNLGPANLIISSVRLTGAHPGDFIIDDHCAGRSLPQGDLCMIDVRFAPTATGSRLGDLTITNNAANSPQRVPLNGVGAAGQPDLVVVALEAAGPTVINQQNQAEAPIRVIVRNQGGTPAEIFKVATEYTGGVISPGSRFVVAFTAQSTEDVDPTGGVYPFTRRPLPPGGEVTFIGKVIFHPAERGVTVSLIAVADSCSSDESMPNYCRVAESNEANNESSPLFVTLPATPTPTPTITPTPTRPIIIE
jgi:hypothetical protein